MTEIARFLAYFLLPRGRYCIFGFCLVGDSSTEAAFTRGSVYAAYSVMTPYMPQFMPPAEILEPADRESPCGDKTRCRSSRWQYANLAALVKSAYGRSGVFAVAYTVDGRVPAVPKFRVRPKPVAVPTAKSLRTLMSARIAAAVRRMREDRKHNVFIVNGYEEYEKPEAVAQQLIRDPTSVSEVLYVDSRMAAYAASASFLHAMAFSR
jgi:hypothetical protein